MSDCQANRDDGSLSKFRSQWRSVKHNLVPLQRWSARLKKGESAQVLDLFLCGGLLYETYLQRREDRGFAKIDLERGACIELHPGPTK